METPQLSSLYQQLILEHYRNPSPDTWEEAVRPARETTYVTFMVAMGSSFADRAWHAGVSEWCGRGCCRRRSSMIGNKLPT